MSREIKLPGPDHQITIVPSSDRVLVRSGETTIADSQSTLVYPRRTTPAVRYIPLADVDRSLLTPSDLTHLLPLKGDASYYSITAGQERGTDAVWFYDQPYPRSRRSRTTSRSIPDRVEITVTVPDTLEA